MVQRDRLAETFLFLVRIDSVSREEGRICRALQDIFTEMGLQTEVDDAGKAIGSETGNLIARLPGNPGVPPLMLNAHMDTVEPGRGVRPIFRNGVFTSDGTTILGADDKSALAILIEAVRIVQETGVPHGPLELVITVCEEIGLLGAKHLDFSRIRSRCGYALDMTDPHGIITAAPSANRLEIKVHGKDAHAGVAPEQGVNAIHLAARALAGLDIGRIDPVTTCNIGVITGGKATNIVPDLVTLSGEVRSHDPEKLKAVTETIRRAFETVVSGHRTGSSDGAPRYEMRVETDFPGTSIPEDHPVVELARQAAKNLGRTLTPKITGGGADANIFFEKGIVTGVLGTGMRDMHTIRESVALDDMAYMAALTVEIVKCHAERYLDKTRVGY